MPENLQTSQPPESHEPTLIVFGGLGSYDFEVEGADEGLVELPPELDELIESADQQDSEATDRLFLAWLKGQDKPDMLWSGAAGLRKLNWKGSKRGTLTTRAEIVGGKVRIQILLINHKGEPSTRPFVVVGNQFVYYRDKAELVHVKNSKGLFLQACVEESLRNREGPVTKLLQGEPVPAELFNALVLHVGREFEADFYFDDKPQVETLVPVEHQLNLTSRGENSAWMMEWASKVGDHEVIFGRIAGKRISKMQQTETLMRRKMTEAEAVECFCDLVLADGAEFQTLIEELVSRPAFRRFDLRKEATEFLLGVANCLLGEEWQLVADPEKGWLQAVGDYRTVFQYIAFAHRVLESGINEFFRNGQTTCYLSPGNQHLLPQLAGWCRTQGIKLMINGLPVREIDLDVSIRIEKGPGRENWFELHPDVRTKQKAMSEDEWRGLLSGRPVESEEGWLLASPEASEMLLSLNKRMPKKSRGTDDKERFAIPRLQVLDWLLMYRDGIEIQLPKSEELVLKSLLNTETLPELPPPPSLIADLRPYQLRGFEWLHFLYHHRFGACLADDMGLGKTVQTIALLAHIAENGKQEDTKDLGPHLIVLPPSLIFNWRAELERFAPDLTIYEYTGTKRSLEPFSEVDIVITSYGLVQRDIKVLGEIPFHVGVFDEAQAIKNLSSARTKAVRQLTCRFKVCLTGTPIENHIGEYYSILDLALPGLLGDYRRFTANVLKDPQAVVLKRARPFVLRRTKSEILTELPPKVESETWLELTAPQKEWYTRMVEEVRAQVEEAYADKPSSQAGIMALTALLRLRQICISPALIDPTFQGNSPKVDYLCEQVKELREEGHSSLVFSSFVGSLNLIEAQLKSDAVKYLRLDGKVSQVERKKRINAFQDSEEPTVFLISLKTGGVGLNLTRASYVFHFDPWWNPAVENQATDRAHRIGQTQTVMVNRLMMRHTVEEKMLALKMKKTELYHQVLSGSMGQGEGGGMITRDDFEFLLDHLED